MTAIAAAAGTVLAAPARVRAGTDAGRTTSHVAAPSSQAVESGYAPVNGLELYSPSPFLAESR